MRTCCGARCAGAPHRAHTQSRAYTPVSSAGRYGSPADGGELLGGARLSSAAANGYDSDGVYNGPPATSAAHHAKPASSPDRY